MSCVGEVVGDMMAGGSAGAATGGAAAFVATAGGEGGYLSCLRKCRQQQRKSFRGQQKRYYQPQVPRLNADAAFCSNFMRGRRIVGTLNMVNKIRLIRDSS